MTPYKRNRYLVRVQDTLYYFTDFGIAFRFVKALNNQYIIEVL